MRLSRQGKNKTPFYRVVLTEHTKPVKSSYKLVLGRYNPLNDQNEFDLEAIKSWIAKGAKPSERLARILLAATKDKLFEKFFEQRTRTAKKKKEDEAK
jgi:small subunit ribosomal protein S16